ncbi:MAG: extracellular solute-binding protein, partial [Candidatus Ornithospirochaeta sp.]
MKKVLSIALVLAFSISLFAGGAKEAAAEEKKLGEEDVTIVFWHSASSDAGAFLDKAVEEFNNTNPYRITVKAIYQGQYSDATTLMKTVVGAENYSELPDVMQLDATGKVDYLTSGRAFTVDDAASLYGDDLSDYVPVALSNWEYKGVQLGLPFATSTTITFYNKDMLEKAGWDRCPETFGEMVALKRDMEKAGITASSYGTVPNTPTLANWLGQKGSYVVDNKNGSEGMAERLVCVENGALEDFLSAWKEMYREGAVVNKSLGTNQFVSGEVAVMTSSS